jgi:hypothetical protein
MIKKILLAALIAGSFGMVVSVPVSAATTIVVREAPPPPRTERMPAARRGYVWAPGHWEWKHNRHAWVRGTWIRDRKGYVYHAPAWEERDGQWHMQRGNWARRDKDGDGVPNGRDDHPNNPTRN